MGLNIKNREVDRLAAKVARMTGNNKTQAILISLRDKELSLRQSAAKSPLKKELLKIAKRCAKLPDLDPRASDEILYDDATGLPD